MPTKSVSFGGVITYPNNNNNNNNNITKKEEKSNSFRSRFNCGVLRSSLKINGSLISVRLVSSKLRKREDSSVVSNNNNTSINNNTVIQETEVRSVSATTVTAVPPSQPMEPPPFLWRYSNYSNASSQFSIATNNDQATLVQTSLPCEETTECKGFRKNLRGKWRRLVKKKPQQEVYTIPAEIKDQLKQIYVY